MRLLSWNINGIRTLPQYHPWNTLKTCEAILDELNADIICFQEMKASRSTLEKNFALPGEYHSFFSFPANKGGYSGVAVYTNSRTVVPSKAEEGLSGKLQPKPPLTEEERIFRSHLSPDVIVLVPDELGRIPSDLLELDTEGRGLVLDFGLFVLINLYCPNETSDARLSYKLNYHLILEARVKQLIEEGREVIVTGDMNICSAPIDHCDGELASRANAFWEHPARAWFRQWLGPEGPMVDVIRECWPERQGMYTCWNTKISARESNYGTRIDYFLLTRGLLPWFKHGDIQPTLKGSDHCPIYIDLHDEIVNESGEVVTLRDVMKMDDGRKEPPRIAAKFWDKYSGKQRLLSNFFTKKSTVSPSLNPDILTSSQPASEEVTQEDAPCVTQIPSDSVKQVVLSPAETSLPIELIDLTSPAAESSISNSQLSVPAIKSQESLPNLSKRKKMQADSNYPAQPAKRPKKQKSGQTKLSSFFGKPADATPISKPQSSESLTLNDGDLSETHCIAPSKSPDVLDCEDVTPPTHHSGDDLAPFLSSSEEASAISVSTSTGSKTAWSQLFAPIQPPKCTVHGEPAKEFTVNKQGPNKGKTFFICSRPVGPGYDAGKAHRLREEVDPKYRCNFFKWSSEVKKASLREAQKSVDGDQGKTK